MPRVLPPNPSLEHLKKQAKALLRAFRAQDVDAHARFREALPRLASADDRVVRQVKVSLQEAQLVLAHEYGFGHWQQLALHVDPQAARPRSHRRMITPPEWSTNTTYVDQESGRAMIGTEREPSQGAMTNEVWEMLTACHDGDSDTVSALLEEDPGLVNAEFNYTTPIHFAVREGHTELCRLLMAQGADLFGYRSYHFHDTLLQMAKERDWTEIVGLLEERLSEELPVSPRANEILAATRSGEYDAVAELLDDDNSLVSASNETGETALHIACRKGRLDLIQLLIHRGANIEAKRAEGHRPIHAALEATDRLAVADFLLGKGAASNIYVATALGDHAAVQRFLVEDPTLSNFLDSHRERPLSMAVDRRDVDTVRLLLGHSADPNLPEHGCPRGGSLHLAASTGQLEMARLLLEHGADPNGTAESSGWVLYVAGDNTEMRELLIAYGAEEPMSDLDLAVLNEDLEAVGRILDENPDAASDSTSMFGEGALSMAANRRNWDLIELLLDRGFTVPDVSKWARAYYFKHYDVAKYLLERGMSPNHMNWHHITLLHDLAHDGDVEKVTLLLDHGADIDPIDNEYRSTPLGLAARAGHGVVVELLLERGADPTKGGAAWSTPLAWARRYERDEIAASIEEAIRADERPSP